MKFVSVAIIFWFQRNSYTLLDNLSHLEMFYENNPRITGTIGSRTTEWCRSDANVKPYHYKHYLKIGIADNHEVWIQDKLQLPPSSVILVIFSSDPALWLSPKA